jgi:hypothetical protein
MCRRRRRIKPWRLSYFSMSDIGHRFTGTEGRERHHDLYPCAESGWARCGQSLGRIELELFPSGITDQHFRRQRFADLRRVPGTGTFGRDEWCFAQGTGFSDLLFGKFGVIPNRFQ